MKQKLLSGLFAVAVVTLGHAQATFYINDGIVNAPPEIPPQIDAVNFVNNNLFTINFTNFTITPRLFDTANTINFTNRGTITGNTGFQFDTATTADGLRAMANSFENTGVISAGSSTNQIIFGPFFSFFFRFGLFVGPKIFVSADHIVNPGQITIGQNGLLSLRGKHIDLNRGGILMEGFDQSFFSDNGISDGYWGIGTNFTFNPGFLFEDPPPTTPLHQVTQIGGFGFLTTLRQLSLPGATPYVRDVFVDETNRVVHAAFVYNTNSAFVNQVFFTGNQIAVEWSWTQTNFANEITTNHLYLFDFFSSRTNHQNVTNGFVGTFPTQRPDNYQFFRGGPLFFGPGAAPGLPPGTFHYSNATNYYTAYEAVFSPTTALNTGVAGQSLTNLPGRVEIEATNYLNLSRARITGLNYTLLKSTNHFAGSSRAQILSPHTDIFLSSTNGQLAITNLLIADLPRLSGYVDVWSGRWTNTTGGVTTRYHVLFVDSHLSPTSQAQVQDMILRSTAGGDGSVTIGDRLNVNRQFLIDAQRLTLTTNEAGAFNSRGELNLLSSQIVWRDTTPRLQWLTNYGRIYSPNAVFFGGSRTQPYYSSTFDEPYLAFVNRGQVENHGSLIWADHFENSGTFLAGTFGSINLQRSLAATLTNGSMISLGGDIQLLSGSLIISNHTLFAGRTLTLAPTNFLTDGYPLLNQFGQIVTTNTPVNGGITNGNIWHARGFNLLTFPGTGDLLGTTISNTSPTFGDVVTRWAGQDRGASTAGFVNNAALGRLILDGGYDGQFSFMGVGANNALYVDYLEFRNYATNRNISGNFENIEVASNMRIYFAQAVMDGVSVAEKLHGANGGRFVWVPDYAGAFSSTNVVYPDGNIYTFNAALVESCTIDSDGDGIVNCADTTPIFAASTMDLSVALLSQPQAAAMVSWNSIPFSANYLYYKPSMTASNWQLLTNFVVGPSGGRVTVADPVGANGARVYRVRVDR